MLKLVRHATKKTIFAVFKIRERDLDHEHAEMGLETSPMSTRHIHTSIDVLHTMS